MKNLLMSFMVLTSMNVMAQDNCDAVLDLTHDQQAQIEKITTAADAKTQALTFKMQLNQMEVDTLIDAPHSTRMALTTAFANLNAKADALRQIEQETNLAVIFGVLTIEQRERQAECMANVNMNTKQNGRGHDWGHHPRPTQPAPIPPRCH
jgi:Spy/CpxP family protein refolding chaperone